MKKFLLLFLVAALPVMVFSQPLARTFMAITSKPAKEKPVSFFAAPFEFEITGDNSVALVGYDYNKEPNPEANELIIPTEVVFGKKSYLITAIKGYTQIKGYARSCFYKNKNITSVIIPPSVRSIGYRAFAYMELESIIIPESVTEIGEFAFSFCNSLRHVEILSPKIDIMRGAFCSCNNLCVVKINSDYLNLDQEAFFANEKNSSKLSEIQVKKAVRPYVVFKDNKYNPKPRITIIDEPQQTTAPTNTYIASTSAAQQPIVETPKIISDVDQNIPQTALKNDKTFAVIIANEKYATESTVDFALNDGKIFKEYCEKTLGIPTENIRFVENGTLGSIGASVEWLQKVLEIYKQDANAIVYYSGHGIPNEATGDAYLLPTDCQGSNFKYAYSINRLYKELGEAGAKSVTYFIDACFSGTQRKGEMMVAARGVAIKAKSGVLSGNSVAFTASSGDETAFAYNEKGHGMFTYFLLKKLQETKGEVLYGELADYIQQNVKQKSIVVSPRLQSPNAISSATASEGWQSWKLTK